MNGTGDKRRATVFSKAVLAALSSAVTEAFHIIDRRTI
jgi:hypothetical protein